MTGAPSAWYTVYLVCLDCPNLHTSKTQMNDGLLQLQNADQLHPGVL